MQQRVINCSWAAGEVLGVEMRGEGITYFSGQGTGLYVFAILNVEQL